MRGRRGREGKVLVCCAGAAPGGWPPALLHDTQSCGPGLHVGAGCGLQHAGVWRWAVCMHCYS